MGYRGSNRAELYAALVDVVYVRELALRELRAIAGGAA